MKRYARILGSMCIFGLIAGCQLTQGVCDCDQKVFKPTCHVYGHAPAATHPQPIQGTPAHPQPGSPVPNQLPVEPTPTPSSDLR